MRDAAFWFLASLLTLSGLTAVAQIDKPRKPIDHLTGVLSVVVSALMIAALVVVRSS